VKNDSKITKGTMQHKVLLKIFFQLPVSSKKKDALLLGACLAALMEKQAAAPYSRLLAGRALFAAVWAFGRSEPPLPRPESGKSRAA
jgi:hypothetical protein